VGGGGGMEELYLQHKELLEACADKLCRRFYCEQLREDLVSAGTVALLTHADRYNPDSGATISTFLYPYIVGAMKRELERSLYPISLSKREFEEICKAGLLFSVVGVSLDSSPEDDEGGESARLISSEAPVHRQVYLKICIEVMREEFENSLSFKERELLGGFFGVFGYEEKTLAELGEQFNMKENAALKAKDKAQRKLAGLCLSGKLGVWQDAYHAVMKSAMKG